jgi:two-component system, response regulator / RNA-binding antiterminator
MLPFPTSTEIAHGRADRIAKARAKPETRRSRPPLRSRISGQGVGHRGHLRRALSGRALRLGRRWRLEGGVPHRRREDPAWAPPHRGLPSRTKPDCWFLGESLGVAALGKHSLPLEERTVSGALTWHRVCSRSRATTRGATGLSAHLKVLLADSDPERMTILEQRLREISDAVIVRAPVGGSLLDAVAVQAPDVIIVDMTRPDRDGLDDLRRVSADNPRPIVMFIDRDDRAFMEEAIAAGVSSYNVVDTAFPDIKPIVMAAVALFRKYQQVADDLTKARASLLERDTINRAKSMLMRQRNIGEPQAYRWLRRRAMNESRRIGDIAAELLASEGRTAK